MRSRFLTRFALGLGALAGISAAGTILPTSGYSVQYQVNANGNIPGTVEVLDGAGLSYTGSQDASTPLCCSASTTVSVAASGGNLGLHGTADTALTVGGRSLANFDLYAFDTFTITGTGTETFNYSVVLEGTESLTGAPSFDDNSGVSSGVFLIANQQYTTWGTFSNLNVGCTSSNFGGGNDCGTIAFKQTSLCASGTCITTHSGPLDATLSGTLTFSAGQKIQLGLYLFARTGSYNILGPANDLQTEFDAGNTAYFTLTPVTNGAGFTTASGLNYSSAPTVPEPSSIAAVVTGLAALRALARRRCRKA
ncbi:MAG TPA: PEP-CTERM sorting domain-containing protein [Candidatus Limnocylindrales bacterium]|nr:PEP-CTERM sorting domain-containing protein [Candidatus Limnocylindrales bacterium]